MKTTYLSLICLILFSIYTISSAATSDAPAPVLDIAGKQLRAGVGYYILPFIRCRGGGLTLTATGNKTCPLDVVQDQLVVSNGLPVTFHPVDPKKSVVRVSTDQNIKFSGASACAQSTVWFLGHDESIQKFIISTGGVEGNPRRETMHSWFKIEEYESDYKLVFCPTVCFRCNVICRDIGVLVEDGQTRLTLTEDTPFRIMFKKA